MHFKQNFHLVFWILAGLVCLCVAGATYAQVSPAEVSDPTLKALEQTNLNQLTALNREITGMEFPFPFVLSRYVGVDPKLQEETDRRGLEFVKFHNRIVLKVTGNYNAAYNDARLTANERASRVLEEVIVPVLRTVTQSPITEGFQAYGFEIGYHVRKRTKNYEYEGKEILVVVLDHADAPKYLSAPKQSAQQEILDRSEIFVNGREFGLALGERQAFSVGTTEEAPAKKGSAPRPAQPPAAPVTAAQTTTSQPPDLRAPVATPSQTTTAKTRLPGEDLLPPALREPKLRSSARDAQAPTPAASTSAVTADAPAAAPAPAPSPPGPADADALQNKLQPQLDELDKAGREKFHFVDYAPASLGTFRNQICLQVTLRNPNLFDRNNTSIYKRAAQSFDLFLAPQLKGILAKVPNDPAIAGLDVTVLTEFSAKTSVSSEALEYILPLQLLQKFTDADITNQEFIDQSVVLVNGVRIALNLQQVE